MIALQSVQLHRIAADVLHRLLVEDSVSAVDVRELSDGAWSVGFEDRWPETRFPTFEIEIQQDWSRERAARELRIALREKLWVCPLCQRRAMIRRLVDTNVFRVECKECGRFEIDSDVLDLFRSGYENDDERIQAALPRLSQVTRSAPSPHCLTLDTWESLAGT